MKKIMLTPVIRRRSSWGVSSCRMMLRITVLTVSAPPRRYDPVDRVRQHEARQRGAHRRRRVLPSVPACADVQDVLREDGERRGGRGEHRGREVEQHGGAYDRLREHEPEAFAGGSPGDLWGGGGRRGRRSRGPPASDPRR